MTCELDRNPSWADAVAKDSVGFIDTIWLEYLFLMSIYRELLAPWNRSFLIHPFIYPSAHLTTSYWLFWLSYWMIDLPTDQTPSPSPLVLARPCCWPQIAHTHYYPFLNTHISPIILLIAKQIDEGWSRSMNRGANGRFGVGPVVAGEPRSVLGFGWGSTLIGISISHAHKANPTYLRSLTIRSQAK